MTDELDDFLDDLQNRINEDTRQTYGQAVFERWREPRFVGGLDNPDGYARVTGGCGDTMQIFLHFKNETVSRASAISDGCGCSMVCGSFAAELALGRTTDQLACITGETILEITGQLPEEERHCAFLAAETLQGALENFMKRDRAAKAAGKQD